MFRSERDLMRTNCSPLFCFAAVFGRFDHVSGAWVENGLERSVKLSQVVPINPRHRAFTLIRVAGMNRNIFYIIGVIVVIVIVLKLLGVF